jgi:hypothetical protein
MIRIDVGTDNPSVGFPLPVVSHNTGLSFWTQWAVSPHSKIRPNTAYFWWCACIVLHYFWFWFSSTIFTSRRWRFLLNWSSNPSVTFLVILASIMHSVLKCFKNYFLHVSWNDRKQIMLTLILLTWSIWWPPNNVSKWQMGFNSAFKRLIRRTFLSLPARCQFSTVFCLGLRKNQTVFSDTACTSVG